VEGSIRAAKDVVLMKQHLKLAGISMTAWNKMMKNIVSIQPRLFYSDGIQKPVDCWDSFIEGNVKN